MKDNGQMLKMERNSANVMNEYVFGADPDRIWLLGKSPAE
jgi:hypothetical protein